MTPTKVKRTAEEEAAWQNYLLSSPLSDAPEGALSDFEDSEDERPSKVGLFLSFSFFYFRQSNAKATPELM